MIQSPDLLTNVEHLKSLVLNPNYKRLHAASAMMNTMIANFKLITKDHLGNIAGFDEWKTACDVAKNASDAVLYTYVTMLVTDAIPASLGK